MCDCWFVLSVGLYIISSGIKSNRDAVKDPPHIGTQKPEGLYLQRAMVWHVLGPYGTIFTISFQ